MSQTIRIPDYHFDDTLGDGKKWTLDEGFTYHSQRYGKTLTIPVGYRSDGATGAFDILSAGWWAHDWLTDPNPFDDGTFATNWQASNILHDILKAEGYWVRAEFWRWATFNFGGEKLK